VPALTVAIEVSAFDKGGLEKVVLDSAIVFRQRGIIPIIVSVGAVGHLGVIAASHGVEVLQLPVSGRDLFYRELLKARNVRLTMSHFSRVGYRIFESLGIPNITFIHNVYAMLAGDALANFRADDALVDKYISVSPKATRYASQRLGVDEAKITTIPNGLILQEHRGREQSAIPTDRAQFGIKDSDYVFLNVASYNLHKAHYLMAQAIEIISGQRDDIKIVCVGNEIYPPHVRQLRDHLKSAKLESLMLMPGFYSDVAPLHKMADAFILPSFIEGWSIAMNEAMFYGKPMILSDTGGSSEVIQNDDIGILLPNEYGDVLNLDAKLLDELAYMPRDYSTAPELVRAMLRFANERQDWAMAGKSGRSKVTAQYDFSDTVDRYLDVIYSSVAEFRLDHAHWHSGRSIRWLDTEIFDVDKDYACCRGCRVFGANFELSNSPSSLTESFEQYAKSCFPSLGGQDKLKSSSILVRLGLYAGSHSMTSAQRDFIYSTSRS
jgi:glycosyltransferase involved in cell wall biosynthesis